jgi:TolB-like protein
VRRRWPTRNVLAVIPLIVLGAATSGAWWWLASPRSMPTADATYVTAASNTTLTPSATDKITAPILSIVVLPFLNLSADKRQDYLSDGITDSLTTYLLRALPGSFVVSRDTAFTYKGKAAEVRQIGRELSVRYVLQGSVLPDGDLVRVNAQLIDAETGGRLWAERFDLKRRDIQQVQDDIVGLLSRAIDLKMIDAEARRSDRERPGPTPGCRRWQFPLAAAPLPRRSAGRRPVPRLEQDRRRRPRRSNRRAHVRETRNVWLVCVPTRPSTRLPGSRGNSAASNSGLSSAGCGKAWANNLRICCMRAGSSWS